MERAHGTESQSLGDPGTGSFLAKLAEAARFWEPRRLVYNLLLTAVAVIWVAATWPHFRPAMTWESLGILTVLALLANLCYCAAYLVDIPLQQSGFWGGGRAGWGYGRWGLWVVGTLLALLFENYWIADEIYPYVQ